MPHTDTITRITGVRTIGVPVRDQGKALEFYTTILGFSKRMDVVTPGGTHWIEVGPASGGPSIALVQEHDKVLAGIETGIRLTTADADADHAAMLAHGVDASEVLRWPGVPPMFSFRDQDGNGLELVQEA